jgi:acyl-coenzyme A synthetase/AMP-(fatty) acid ligase
MLHMSAPTSNAALHPLSRLVDRAMRAPATPALVSPGGAVTYGELHAMACDAAAQFERLGLRHGARTAVLGGKSPETIALVLACLLTGRPVLLPSVDLDPAVVQTLLRQAAVEHALTAEPFDGADVVRPSREAVAAGAVGPACVPGVDDVALLLATSGSTGLPKVVPIRHGAILRFASWASDRFDIGPGTNVLSYCGLNFDLSILEVWTTLLHGGCAVLVAHDKATQPDHLLDLVLRHEVNVVQGVPMLLGLLLDAADARGCTLPSVTHTILTGDAASMTLLARLPGPFEHSRLYNVYGCTETNDSFIHVIDVRRELRRGAIPLGDPLPGVSALIVHDGRMIEGPGSGELWVSTPFQANGYLGRRSLDDGFAPPPGAQTEGHYFRSRDLVRRDASGTVYLEGRTDAQVKVRGVRVNLHAVEQALLTDPDVAEAAVVAVDDELAGKRLIAVVRRRPGARLNTVGLRARCAKDLGRIAVPAIIEIQDDALPKTTTGKVDRAAVRRRCQIGGA